MPKDGYGRPLAGSGTSRSRVFGYCGRGGDAGLEVLATARALAPRSELIASSRAGDGAPAQAFGLALEGVPSVAHVQAPNGSFMMIDGRFLDEDGPTEEMLHEWRSRGSAAFAQHRFHGLIVVWSAATNECTLLRDPFGLVPGFVAGIDGGVVFGTDLDTLIRFGIDPTPDAEALDAFFATGYFPAPLTPLAAVSKIPPGHSVTITAAGMSESVPWFHHDTPEPTAVNEAVELMPHRFETALRRLWPQDGDAGLLLSGGVDSAMILAGATRMLGRPIRTFTFRYEEYDGTFNEGRHARAIADHLGAPHEEIPIQPGDILDDLDGAVAAYGEPFTWGWHSYQLGPLAERGITSVFNGAGADGWSLSKRHRAALRFNEQRKPTRSMIRAAVRATRPLNWPGLGKAEWVTRSVSGLGDLYSPDDDRNRRLRRRLYRDPGLADAGSRRLLELYTAAAAEYADTDAERTIVLMDKRFNAAEQMVLWNRSWSLAFGLELCLPYYDHDLLDLAMSIEGDTTGKDVLRRIADGHLPAESARAPKTPQQMPVDEWLRGPLLGGVRERLVDLPEPMAGILEPTGVSRLVDEHARGRADHGWRLIGLLTTAAWFDRLPR